MSKEHPLTDMAKQYVLDKAECECLKESKSRIHPCYLPAQWHCVLKPCEVSGRVDFALRLDSGHVQCFSLTRENAEVFVKTFQDCLYGKFTVSLTSDGFPRVSVSRWREEVNMSEPAGEPVAVLSEPESRTHPSYRPARWRCVLKPCEVSGRIAFSLTLDSGQAQRFSLAIGNAEVFVKMLQECLNGYLSISHSAKSYGISSEDVSTPQESESVAPIFKSPAAPSGSS